MTDAIVRYKWAAGDTDTVGSFDVQWEITWPGSEPQTVPTKGFYTVTVYDDLNATQIQARIKDLDKPELLSRVLQVRGSTASARREARRQRKLSRGSGAFRAAAASSSLRSGPRTGALSLRHGIPAIETGGVDFPGRSRALDRAVTISVSTTVRGAPA